jgi:hypothetical protein
MRVLANTLGFGACLLLVAPAEARDLAVVNVTPQVACVFTQTCAVNANDTYGIFRLFGNGGEGRLLTRTYPGLPGAPGAGLTGYSFYLDLGPSTALGTANCVERLVIDTGPLVALPYTKGGTAEIFVVAGQGPVGLASATQAGSKVTFTFTRPICPAAHDGRHKWPTASLYFGFAAKGAPSPGKAQLVATMDGSTAEVRVPKH